MDGSIGNPGASGDVAGVEAKYSNNLRIVLCLSGGGFRATFFHLGVIRCLRHYGLLEHVVEICAVSGGSIIAAHLVQNWPKYLQDESTFQESANELIAFGQIDLRGRILRRLLLGFGLFRRGRLKLLQSYYGDLYRNARLRDLSDGSDGIKRPEVHLLCTSMTTGSLCAFTKDGLIIDGGDKSKKLQSSLIPLAIGVAASSAFPPLFPPVRITKDSLDVTAEDLAYEDYLSDGGIFDNLGVRRVFNIVNAEGRHFDLLIASDASAPFNWDVESNYGSIIARTVRSTDILMKRVTDLETGGLAGGSVTNTIPCLRIAIHDRVERSESHAALDVELQKKVGRLRTDLDRFSPEEISSLEQHGYAVADKNLNLMVNDNESTIAGRMGSGRSQSTVIAKPESSSIEILAELLTKGRNRHWRIWSSRDWVSWAGLCVLLFPVFIIYGLGYLTSAAPREAQIRELRGAFERRSEAVAQVVAGAATAISIPFATTRERDDPGPPDGTFGSDVGPLITGNVVVSIPESHRVGALEKPVWSLLESEDSERHIVVIATTVMPGEGWLDQISTRQQPLQRATIFVPGYNVTFAQSSQRAAILQYDLNIRNRVILYSWPSVGNAMAYAQDLDRAEFAAPAFVDVVAKVQGRSQATNLLAYHQGAVIVTRALESLGKYPELRQLNEVVLVIPDVDGHALTSALSRASRLFDRATVYVSADDLVMKLSEKLNGGQRAGAKFRSSLDNVDVIEASPRSRLFPISSMTGEFLADLRLVLQGVAIEERPTVVRRGDGQWEVRG